MSASDRVNSFLVELAKESGSSLKLEDNGVCRIRVDGKNDVVVEAHDNMGLVFLHAPVMPLAGIGDREKAYEAALSMALFGVGTGGCVLGYDQPGDQLVLSISRPADSLDAAGFVSLFSNFITIAGKVREGLAQAVQAGGEASPRSGAPAGTPYLRA